MLVVHWRRLSVHYNETLKLSPECKFYMFDSALSIKTVGGLTHQHVYGMLQLDTIIRVAGPLEKTTGEDHYQWSDHQEGPLSVVRP